MKLQTSRGRHCKLDFSRQETTTISVSHAWSPGYSSSFIYNPPTYDIEYFPSFRAGMEFPREYSTWRDDLATMLVAPVQKKAKNSEAEAKIEQLRSTLIHHIDRLWYDGVLETIRTGDVYNPGARHRVPRLYLVNSHIDEKLGRFPVGESFRLSATPDEKYEVLIKRPTHVIVRNVEGYISKMPRSTLVKREGNLTRGPDGNAESRVALATFPGKSLLSQLPL